MYLGMIDLSWLKDAVVPLTQTYAQVQTIKAQTERMKRGLPPADPSAYAPAPARMQATVGADKTTLIVGGIALAAVLAVVMLRGARR
jgi:hypothetical protein